MSICFLKRFSRLSLDLLCFRSHRGLLDAVLASQPDPSPHDGCRAQVPLDHFILPELRHPPSGGRHLLLPQLRPQPVPLQPVVQTVQGGVHPGAALPPHHRTHQQAQREERPPCVFTLPPAPAHKVLAPQQGRTDPPGQHPSASYNLSEGK